MSREIKFRIMYKKYPNIWLKDEYILRDLIEMDGAGFLGDDDIVELYTGLKDKNGVEIYEGDILETCCGKTEVYFDDELLMYKIKARHGGTMPLVSKKSKRHFDYEIIGNIHENPELIGGKE